ncbi:Pentatricopeptide repeat-containing protein [Trichinella pseudospiralis]
MQKVIIALGRPVVMIVIDSELAQHKSNKLTVYYLNKVEAAFRLPAKTVRDINVLLGHLLAPSPSTINQPSLIVPDDGMLRLTFSTQLDYVPNHPPKLDYYKSSRE